MPPRKKEEEPAIMSRAEAEALAPMVSGPFTTPERSPWPPSGESDDSPLDGPDQKFVAEARERVRNGTADFGDARRLLQILDKVTGA